MISCILPRNSCLVLEFDTAESSSIVSEWGLVCDLNYRSKVGAATGCHWLALAMRPRPRPRPRPRLDGTGTGTGNYLVSLLSLPMY